jgi:general stress protein YciG
MSPDAIWQGILNQQFTRNVFLLSWHVLRYTVLQSKCFSPDWRFNVFEVRKARRGFASMSPEKQREIASKGGRAAHAKGTAHEWSADEARRAGRKGGQASRGGRGKLPSVA